MITKKVMPLIDFKAAENPKCVGTVIEYRLFGILICKKSILLPNYYGVTQWEYPHKF